MEEIVAALEAEGTDWAEKVLEVCRYCTVDQDIFTGKIFRL